MADESSFKCPFCHAPRNEIALKGGTEGDYLCKRCGRTFTEWNMMEERAAP